MDQRRLRLGDILDDYCPRERRITNHAVVAMIEEDVKQTRCTTCDAEHVYKGGKAPRRKKAETTGRLYKEVLAGITDQPVIASSTIMAAHDEHDDDTDVTPQPTDDDDIIAGAEDQTAEDVEDALEGAGDSGGAPVDAPDEGPVHRPLIRAQLPRPDGMKVERQAPDFTIRQNGGRNGNFRGRNNNTNNNGGHRFGRGPHRGNSGGGQRFDRGPRKRSR